MYAVLEGVLRTGDVKGLEHDFSRVFSVFRRVEGRLGEEEVVLRGLHAQVFEHAVLPVVLHQVPVLDNAMAHGVLHAVSRVLKGLVTNEEI